MDDPAFVGGPHRVGQRNGNLEQLRQRQAAGRDEVAERPALDEFHREEVNPVRLLDAVERDDVRVVEGGDGLGLAPEAMEPVGIGRGLRRERLQRHHAAQLKVLGGVDVPHAAVAEGPHDAIVLQRGPKHGRTQGVGRSFAERRWMLTRV